MIWGRTDFVYPDFNETLGLRWVGDVGTSNCIDFIPNDYGTVQNLADIRYGGQRLHIG